MNKYYTYPNINRWDPKHWEDHKAAADPLLDYLVPAVYESEYEKNAATDRFQDRTDGVYDAKTNMYTFSDIVERWEQKGLHYHCTSMGFIAWQAVIPQTVLDRKVTESKVLVVPYCADIRDSHWAMNTLENLAHYHDTAVAEDTTMLYLVFGSPKASGIYMDIMLELSAIFRVDLNHTYMDLSALKRQGMELSEIPGLDRLALGEEITIGDIPAVDITDRWVARVGHQFICNNLNRHTHGYNAQRHEHSTVGHYMADSMEWEYCYQDCDDPKLLAHWTQMGLKFDKHYTKGERWLTFTPKCAFDEPEKKIPVLLVMKEVRDAAPFLTLTAFQFYHDFFEIAAQGEFMMLFFALETPDDNDLLIELLNEVKDEYPIDPERVYIIGQSHNGNFALEFARRHPDVITAVAQLNDRHMLNAPQYCVDNLKMTDEMIEEMAKHDMPLINICGHAENVFAHVDEESEEFLHNCEGFNRRLKAFRCPQRPLAEIMAAHKSTNRAIAMNGIPADRSEIRYCMGSELYISELKNTDGKWHLTLVSVENLPHMITPQMSELSWSFLRRFARDLQTGEIKELY